MTQTELANRLGMKLTAIQRWEWSQVNPSPPAMAGLHQIATELKLPDLASVFAYGAEAGPRLHTYGRVVGELPQVRNAFAQIDLKLAACSDPALNEYQRGSLAAEALRISTEGGALVTRLLAVAL